MSKPIEPSREEQLCSLHKILADVIPNLTAEEVEEEIRARGDDPRVVAEEVRQLLLNAVKEPER